MGRFVRMIVCLCWRDPAGDEEKIKDYIIKAEQRRGNDTSGAEFVVRNVYDEMIPDYLLKTQSFIWNNLKDEYSERYGYDTVYDKSNLNDLVHGYTRPREVTSKDGRPYVKYFVLYRDSNTEAGEEDFW